MSISIQLIVAVLDMVGILFISNLVRRKQLELKYVLVWYLVGILLLLLDLIPGVMGKIAAFLNIELPVNMLFFFGFIFVVMIIFSQTVVISNLTRRNIKLVQELGLTNKKIDDLIEKYEKK